MSASLLRAQEAVKTWVALFRGVNVGGRGRLPMKELRTLLTSLGCESVTTYVQSGNAVFRHPDADAIGERVSQTVKRDFGFQPAVLVIGLGELEDVVRVNPFPEAAADPVTLHANFLSQAPASPDLEGLDGLRRDSERFELRGRVLYLHAPEGIARSKLAAGAERRLGVPMTGRNWRSVTKILDIARQVEGST